MWLPTAQNKPKHANRVFPAHLRDGTAPDVRDLLKNDTEPSGHDRARVGAGPVSVEAPAPAPDTGGLPSEWLGGGSDKQVDHD
jgi:hypothetical protein